MKKNIIAFLAALCFSTLTHATTTIETPDEFYVTQHWLSYTSSFDIETKTHRIGTLYRRLISLMLTYDFYNNANEKLATARSRFFSLTAKFDVHDQDDVLLGTAEEQLFSFFPSFTIYGPDESTKLAYATMNFWGTKYTVYDPATDQEMAVMSRPFFRIKNNWTIQITNSALFSSKQIDSRLLMTILAFQGDREYWEQQRNDNTPKLKAALPLKTALNDSKNEVAAQTKTLLTKISSLEQSLGMNSSEKITPETLEAVANELQQQYDGLSSHQSIESSSQLKLKDFTDFCMNVVESASTPVAKKQAILSLLKMRLEGGVV